MQRHIGWLLYVAVCVALITVGVRRDTASRTLVVKRSELDAARTAQASLRSSPMGADEQVAFDAEWIEGRVLLHEARRRGLDRQDPLIRSAILGSVIASLSRDIPEPTPEGLRAYFAEHQAAYAQPEVLDLSLATFPAGVRTPPETEVRTRLERGEPPEVVGPAAAVGAYLKQVSKADLHRLFGRGFAERIWTDTRGTWIGPVDSTLGSHFVRIDGRSPPRTPPYDEVRDVVRQDWFSEEERRQAAPTIAALRARLAIEAVDR